jgi:hypothetical protein
MAQRLDETAKGVYIIAATPFTDNGELDLDSAERMTDFYRHAVWINPTPEAHWPWTQSIRIASELMEERIERYRRVADGSTVPETIRAAVADFPTVRDAVDTVILTIQSGIPVARTRWLAVLITGAMAGMAGQLAAQAIAGQAERFDLFGRLPHRVFPGGRALRTPALVLGMLWYRLRDLI